MFSTRKLVNVLWIPDVPIAQLWREDISKTVELKQREQRFHMRTVEFSKIMWAQ